MRTLGTAALTTALLLSATACGESSRTTETSEPDRCAEQGTVVTRADLDGDGTRRPVRLAGPGGGACSGTLTADGGDEADVADLDLVEKGASAVHLADGPDLVLLYSQPHPRGGAQPHLFGAGGGTNLVEVTAHGQPVIPFVATDGGAAPMTATCTDDGGIALIKGTASQPPGVVLAWDLSETTYEIKGAKVTDTRTKTVRKDAADPLLRKEMPELFDGSLFSDCS